MNLGNLPISRREKKRLGAIRGPVFRVIKARGIPHYLHQTMLISVCY
jgi:hypothetical protein